jgi:hypothetical protein
MYQLQLPTLSTEQGFVFMTITNMTEIRGGEYHDAQDDDQDDGDDLDGRDNDRDDHAPDDEDQNDQNNYHGDHYGNQAGHDHDHDYHDDALDVKTDQFCMHIKFRFKGGKISPRNCTLER